MYGMVGGGGGGGAVGSVGGGGGGGGGESRTSSTRSRRSLRDQQAKRSLRNYRQQSTFSLHERSGLRTRSSSDGVTGSTQGGTGTSGGGGVVGGVGGASYFKTIREATGPGGGILHDSSADATMLKVGGSGSNSKRLPDTAAAELNKTGNSMSVGYNRFTPIGRGGSTGGLKTNFNGSRKGDTDLDIDEIEKTSMPSPTHDIYCCSNINSGHKDNKNNTATPTGHISNCCGVRYYHKDVNCEAYSAPASPTHHHPHYHHYEHSHHHLISICRRLMRIIKQAWTGVKFGSGEWTAAKLQST